MEHANAQPTHGDDSQRFAINWAKDGSRPSGDVEKKALDFVAMSKEVLTILGYYESAQLSLPKTS